jgi:hypothetical protein
VNGKEVSTKTPGFDLKSTSRDSCHLVDVKGDAVQKNGYIRTNVTGFNPQTFVGKGNGYGASNV